MIRQLAGEQGFIFIPNNRKQARVLPFYFIFLLEKVSFECYP